MKKILTITLVACFCATNVLAQDFVEVPIEFDKSGLILTKVSLSNKAPQKFVINTSFNSIVLSAYAASDLHLTLSENEKKREGIEQHDREYALYDVERVSVGNYPVTMDQIAAIKMNENYSYTGVLGGPLFSQGVVEINLDDEVIRVHPSKYQPPPDYWSKTKVYGKKGENFIIPISIDNKEMVALIDTGSAVTIVNEKAAGRLGMTTERIYGRIKLGSGGNVGIIAKLFYARFLIIAGLKQSISELYAADINRFKKINIDDGPAIILGMDYLQYFNIIIDRKNGLIYFQKRLRG